MEKIAEYISSLPFWFSINIPITFALYIAFEFVYLKVAKEKTELSLFFTKSSLWDLFSIFLVSTSFGYILNNFFFFNLPFVFYEKVNGLRITFFDGIPYYLKLFLVFIIYDFLSYWRHRFWHSTDIGWAAHNFHHSATNLTPLTVLRDHPIQNFISALIGRIPLLIIFGMTFSDSLILITFNLVIGGFQHGKIDTNLGWLGRHVIVTPRFHFLHHQNSRTMNSNYGDMLVIWDKIFNTYTPPNQSIKKIVVGMDDNFFITDSPIVAFFKPVFFFYREFFRYFKKIASIKFG
jgi:sterol desaturase/sphingolipid hydroxylase (fatty acid hydroxylase superfamily)